MYWTREAKGTSDTTIEVLYSSVGEKFEAQ